MNNQTLILENELAEAYVNLTGKGQSGSLEIDRFGRLGYSSSEDTLYYAFTGVRQEELAPSFVYSFDNILFEKLKQRTAKAKGLIGIEDKCISLMNAEILQGDGKYVCKTRLVINDERYQAAQKTINLLDKISSDSLSIIADKQSRQLLIENAKFLKENNITLRDLYENKDIFFSQYEFKSYLKNINDNTVQVKSFGFENNPIKLYSTPGLKLFEHLHELGDLSFNFDYIEMLKEQSKRKMMSGQGMTSQNNTSLEYYSQMYQGLKENSNRLFMVDSSLGFNECLKILSEEGYLDIHFPFTVDGYADFLLANGNNEAVDYYIDLYKEDGEGFLDYFQTRSSYEKKNILKEIMSCDLVNEYVAGWLDENEVELVREASMG